ncbi:carbonic anhydrase 12-like [Haemaphysalis longicornis]
MHTSFRSFRPIYFLGYNARSRFEIENGGHFLYITPQKASLETYGGPLPARYNLSKAIFRFGNETSERGSEHTIDGRNFAAELQLLLSSEKPTPADCLRSGKGLAILVILFEKQEAPNVLLDDLVRSTEQMTFRGNKTVIRMPLSYLLPNTTLHYYVYLGSLTFPPCTNHAYVVVFSNTVGIGQQQLTKLRNNLYTMVNNCKYRMAGNLRHQQPLGNRVVYRSFKFSSSATTAAANMALLMIAAAASAAGLSLHGGFFSA